MAQVFVSNRVLHHLADIAVNAGDVFVPCKFCSCSAAEISCTNINTQPWKLRIQIESDSGTSTGNGIFEVIAS